jgi:hypothetical protein
MFLVIRVRSDPGEGGGTGVIVRRPGNYSATATTSTTTVSKVTGLSAILPVAASSPS